MTSLSFAELIKRAVENRLLDVHTAIVARVESYNSKEQTVDVRPQLKHALEGKDGELVFEKLPIIADVPVLFPRAGGFFISFPIQEGDFVQLFFNESPISDWWNQEETNIETTRHSLGGAVAIPGVYPKEDSLAEVSTENMVLGKEEGTQIHLLKDEIRLGDKDSEEALAFAEPVLEAFKSIINKFNSHIHPGLGKPILPPITATCPAPFATKKVKAS